MPLPATLGLGLVGIGDNVVDLYLDQNVYYPGGNVLNVSVLSRRFGLAKVAYIGIIGNDEEGAHVHACLLAEGLSDTQLRQAHGETGKAQVNIINGDRVFAGSNKGGVRKRLMLRMDEDDLDIIRRLGHVHSSCFSYLEPELPRIRAQATGLSFDFSTNRDEHYLAEVCPFLTTAFLSGSDLSDPETKAFASRIHALGTPEVCITQGERGAFFSDGRQIVRQNIIPTKVIDTMGAGDAFIAGFLTSRIHGANIEESMYFGASSASRSCGWQGAFGYPQPNGSLCAS